ncbi:MAG: DUF7210 family protein [Halothiobacillus sp.]
MKVKLTKPHEHAGRVYPIGTELDVIKQDADWLIAIEKAAPAVPAATSTPTQASTTSTSSSKGDK